MGRYNKRKFGSNTSEKSQILFMDILFFWQQCLHTTFSRCKTMSTKTMSSLYSLVSNKWGVGIVGGTGKNIKN